jgi:hypothetical protein
MSREVAARADASIGEVFHDGHRDDATSALTGDPALRRRRLVKRD